MDALFVIYNTLGNTLYLLEAGKMFCCDDSACAQSRQAKNYRHFKKLSQVP